MKDKSKAWLIFILTAVITICIGVILFGCKNKQSKVMPDTSSVSTEVAVSTMTKCREQYDREGTPIGCNDKCLGGVCAKIHGQTYTYRDFWGRWHELDEVLLCGCLPPKTLPIEPPYTRPPGTPPPTR